MFYIRIFSALLLSGLILLAACHTDENQFKNKTGENSSASKSPIETITSQQVLKAALNGNEKLVKKAMEQGVDITKADQSGRTPLMLASYNGHSSVVKYLLEHEADPEKTDIQGQTPLIFAASGPYPQTVQLLLETGADPNKTDSNEGWSALMWAAAEGNEQVVKILLNHGADPDLRDKDDETARDFAESNGYQKIAGILNDAEESKKN